MENQMLKDLIKSGFVVKLKSGELRMVMRAGSFTHVLVADNGHTWSYLSRWRDDDLTRKRENTSHINPGSGETVPGYNDDIVEIYGLVQGVRNYDKILKISTEDRPIVWRRNPPRKMTLEEVERELGFPIELVSSN